MPLILYAVLLGYALYAIFLSGDLYLQIGSVVLVFFVGRRLYPQFFIKPRLRIDIENGKVIVPAIPSQTHWPVDLQGQLVQMPGFEYYGNLNNKPPFFDGTDRFAIPFKNLTGIWIDHDIYGGPILVIGTNFFDTKFWVRAFGQKKLMRFLAENIPADLLREENRLNSVLYQVYVENLRKILEATPQETTQLIKKRVWNPLWVGIAIYAIVWLLNLVTQSVDLVCVFSIGPFLGLVWAYAYLQIRRSQKLVVDEARILIGSERNYHAIRWEDIRYVFQTMDNFILWSKTQRLVLPKEIARRGQLFALILKKHLINGSIQGKWGVSQMLRGNKNTRFTPEQE